MHLSLIFFFLVFFPSLWPFLSLLVCSFPALSLSYILWQQQSKVWSSNKVINVATCNNELDGTNISTILKEKVAASQEKVTTLVTNQLAFVQQTPNDTVSHGFQYFPWLETHASIWEFSQCYIGFWWIWRFQEHHGCN